MDSSTRARVPALITTKDAKILSWGEIILVLPNPFLLEVASWYISAWQFTQERAIGKSSKRVEKFFSYFPRSTLISVRYRPMRANDIRKCVEHLAAHPTLGPLYGKLMEQVPLAISRVLRDDNVTINLFEEFQNSTTRLLGAGMAVFVSDDFLREAKTTPFFWVGPELVKRITTGKSPLLSEAEVRDANSTDGLNLMVRRIRANSTEGKSGRQS